MDQVEEEKQDLSNEDLLGAQSLLLSDSEDDKSEELAEDKNNVKNVHHFAETDEQRIQNSPQNIELRESEDTMTLDEISKPKVKSRILTLIDSDSEASNDSTQCDQILDTLNQSHSDSPNDTRLTDKNENNNINVDNHETEKNKKMRISAKAALDEIKAIQSEQQRLHREAHISIPYHKPKKHTLDEFLKRRSNSNTSQQVVNSVKLFKNLKMPPEELRDYAILMEERAKEASTFFKSESDCEEEKYDIKSPEKCCELSVEEAEKNFKSDDPTINKSEQTIDTFHTVCFNKDTNSIVNTSETLTDIALTVKPRITEVIELPRIDLQDVNILKSSDTTKKCSRSLNGIKRLILENKITESPTLKGDSSMLIDFDTGTTYTKRPTKADHLLQKLLLTNKSCIKKSTGQPNISLNENETECTKANIKTQDDFVSNKEQKPGAALFKLKENLKNVIKKKRLEDIKKKHENEQKELSNHNDVEDNFEETRGKNCEADFDDEETSLLIENDDDENFTKACDYNVDENKDEKCESDFDDEETSIAIDNDDEENIISNYDYDADDDIDNDEDENNDENEDSDEYEDEDENENESKDEQETIQFNESKNSNPIKLTRIIQKFEDDSEDEINIYNNPDAISSKTMAKLLNDDNNTHINADEEIDELIGLCSGQFGVTQTSNQALISQDPDTQNNHKNEEAEDFLHLNSSASDVEKQIIIQNLNETKIKTSVEKDCKPQTLHVPSDEENVIILSEKKKNVRKLSKSLKKREMKLGFSDEEDSDVEVDEDQVENEAYPDTFIDYDSEENEIVVEMSKDQRLKQTEKFFENEAELSESDWGSADEDETNMNKYDIELGDEDDFDGEKLQTELGQIHARKMLDDDIKEVRKIQDMLFEDEEDSGVGRQRQFRWKNAERGFGLEDANQNQTSADRNISDDDENDEHAWRKIRFEREQVLKQHGINEESSTTQFLNCSLTNITKSNENQPLSTTKKINIIKIKNETLPKMIKDETHFLIPKVTKTHNKPSRGSFLIRDDETLNKIIKGTKSRNDVEGGGSVSITTVKPKNFVFATLTEEEHENLKRKANDLLNNSNENGINFMKRPHKKPRREKCFIDQLLQ
ncbi:claspin [Teleopsis dalmanni]|uniref:claspin n=1 Tax=Teleopsis dalmanni TaxID=139649 RepID=UPI0018CE0F3A|nr:claspin [Teleopsis dalmanni]